MKRIFKYTVVQRIPSIILYCAVMLCMTIIELFFLGTAAEPFEGFYLPWFVLTLITISAIPLFLFIKCSSGYARNLLFTNESYLILTLPVPIEQVLLGRMLVGLVELIICTAISCILLGLISICSSTHLTAIDMYMVFQMLSDVLLFIFIKNYQLTLTALCIFFASFCVIGNTALVVQTIIRSFNINKLKGLWIVGFIFICTSILVIIGRIEAEVMNTFGSYYDITVYGMHYTEGMSDIVYTQSTVTIPALSILISFGIGVCFFFVSAQLFKKRVEV